MTGLRHEHTPRVPHLPVLLEQPALDHGAAEPAAQRPGGGHAWRFWGDVGADSVTRIATVQLIVPDSPGPLTLDITLTDGTTVGTDDPEAAARVSADLDHEVTLWPLRPADDLDHYRRGAPDSDDLLEELRSIFGRDEDEPLPDLSVFPPEILEFESPLGTYVDAFPVLVMTTSALRTLTEALPDQVIDVRRFRPNVIVDTGDEPGHPELGWQGRRLRLGEAELELVTPCPRCVMVTREVTPDIPADRGILRHVIRELDQNLGMYANVIRPGRVERGDPVELI